MAIAANLGFPRIGTAQLKRAVEEFWEGNIEAEELRPRPRRALAAGTGSLQHDVGHRAHSLGRFLALRPRARYGGDGRRGAQAVSAWATGRVDLPTYFRHGPRHRSNAAPLDMTKWFDTNYHYLVPEFEPGMRFRAGLDRADRRRFERPGPWASTPGRCCSGRCRCCCWARASGRPGSAGAAGQAVARL